MKEARKYLNKAGKRMIYAGLFNVCTLIFIYLKLYTGKELLWLSVFILAHGINFMATGTWLMTANDKLKVYDEKKPFKESGLDKPTVD